MSAIASEKDNLRSALEIAPTAMDSLHLGFDHSTGSQNSRVGISGNIWTADGFICGLLQQAPGVPRALKDVACDLIAQLLSPIVDNLPPLPPGYDKSVPKPAVTKNGRSTCRPSPDMVYAPADDPSLDRAARRWVVTPLTRTLRWLLATTLGAALLTGCDFDGAYDLPLPGSPVDADEAYEVTAEFADVLNVVPRSPVMVDDVVVGEVTEVERVGWHAEVVLRIKDDVVLPDNAIADIQQVSLLGEKYVALEEPTEQAPSGRLEDGDDIPLSVTGRNPEVEEVLGALSFLLEWRRGGPARHHHPGGEPGDVGSRGPAQGPPRLARGRRRHAG